MEFCLDGAIKIGEEIPSMWESKAEIDMMMVFKLKISVNSWNLTGEEDLNMEQESELR